MIRRCLLLLAVAVTVAAQVRTGTVSGTIQSESGAPATSIRVTAIAADDGAIVASALTDNSGRYRLDDVPAGNFFIAAGLVTSPTYSPGTSDKSAASAIAVTSGARITNLNFKIKPASGGSISGVVTGLPLKPSRELLRLFRITLTGPGLRDRGGILEVPLKDDGTFEFRSLPAGEYMLSINNTIDAINVPIFNANVEGVKLPAPKIVMGRITSEDGKPLPSTQILTTSDRMTAIVTATRLDMKRSLPVIADADGQFFFAAVRGIRYQIGVSSLPFGYYLKTSLDTPIEVDDGPTPIDLNIVVTKQRPQGEPEGVSYSGRVTAAFGTLPPDPTIELEMSSRQHIQGIPLEKDGTFKFPNVPPGKYTVRLYSQGMPLLGFNTPKSIVVGSADMTDEFEWKPPLRLSGRVQIENQNRGTFPLIQLQFTRPGDSRRYSGTVTGGAFAAILLEGTYTVATSPQERFVVQSVSYGGQDATAGLVIDPSKPAEELIVTLRSR
jgi:hypothetical protein